MTDRRNKTVPSRQREEKAAFCSWFFGVALGGPDSEDARLSGFLGFLGNPFLLSFIFVSEAARQLARSAYILGTGYFRSETYMRWRFYNCPYAGNKQRRIRGNYKIRKRRASRLSRVLSFFFLFISPSALSGLRNRLRNRPPCRQGTFPSGYGICDVRLRETRRALNLTRV